MVKVEGTDDIYDLTPAPGTVTEEGTFLNVENLLKDTTAALLGGDSSMVPDEAFAALKKLISENAVVISSVIATGAVVEIASYTGTGGTGSGSPCKLTFSGTPLMLVIVSNQGSWGFCTHAGPLIGGASVANSANTTVRNGKEIRWYSDNAGYQLNKSGEVYYVTALMKKEA